MDIISDRAYVSQDLSLPSLITFIFFFFSPMIALAERLLVLTWVHEPTVRV